MNGIVQAAVYLGGEVAYLPYTSHVWPSSLFYSDFVEVFPEKAQQLEDVQKDEDEISSLIIGSLFFWHVLLILTDDLKWGLNR